MFKIKLALKIGLAIYPSITLFMFLFGGLLANFSLPIRTLVLTVVLVPWVVFVGLPIIDFLQKSVTGNGRRS